MPYRGLTRMDAAALSPPRRLTVPIRNRWGDGDMAVLDFGDPKRPVDLVFVHANGFNAATYRTLLQPLGGSLRIWAPDLRGHGRSRLPAVVEGRRGWGDLRDDLAALLDAIDGPPVVMAGHSMGGTSALLAAAERPERVSGLVMMDPVIWPRPMALALNLPLVGRMAANNPMVRGALKRRALFDSREQALNGYRGKGAFKGWPDMILADYLSDGLIETDQGLALTCAREWEASNYGAQANDPWRAMKRLQQPIRVLRGEIGSTCALSAPPRGQPLTTIETVAGGTHFFPMLKPDIARDALFDAAV